MDNTGSVGRDGLFVRPSGVSRHPDTPSGRPDSVSI